MADVSGVRSSKYSHPGELNGRHKVRKAQVVELRQLYRVGWTLEALGTEFGLSKAGVAAITSRRNWRHVE
jgi:hypothetical protein